MSYGLFALGALALLALSRSSAPAPSGAPKPNQGPTPKPSSGPSSDPVPGPGPGPSSDPVPSFPPVFFVGDEHALHLAAPLAAKLGAAVVPAAVPMSTCASWTADDGTDAWTARWAGQVWKASPIALAASGIGASLHTVALVSLGRYDGAQKFDPARLRLEVRAILAALHLRASSVAWVLPPQGPDPWGARFVIREVAREEGVRVFDAASIVIARGPDLQPNQQGYAEWAGALAAWLRAAGPR